MTTHLPVRDTLQRADTAATAQVRDPLNRGTALARGLLGWLVMCVGLGIAIGIVSGLEERLGLHGISSHLVRAALMGGIVVPTILILRSRLDRRSAAGQGWAGRAASARPWRSAWAWAWCRVL